MRGTELAEIGRGGFYIAVVILYSAIVKRLELGTGEQPHGGAAFDIALPLDLPDRIGDLFHFLIRYSLTASHQGKTPDALLPVVYRMADTFLGREQRI